MLLCLVGDSRLKFLDVIVLSKDVYHKQIINENPSSLSNRPDPIYSFEFNVKTS